MYLGFVRHAGVMLKALNPAFYVVM